MKAIVSAKGLMAQSVNPYKYTPDCNHPILENCECEKWAEFERRKQARPLTTPQEPGVTIEVKEVWQYLFLSEWCIPKEYSTNTYGDFSALYNANSFATRIALEPIKQSDAEEPTHPLNGCNLDKDNCTPHEEYVDAVIVNRKNSGLYEYDCVTLKNPPQSEWNLAIDEAVKVLDVEWNYENGVVLCDHTILNTIQRIKYLLKKLKKN